ncbi:MAG: histidine kinase N-terminal 7TM domain-containing protein, partial [Anaerolineae bacterium]
METITLTGILEFASLALSSAVVILDFSLLIYILAQNLQSPVAQAFAEMMAFVALIYLVDVTIVSVETAEAARIWLQIQWLGIAFVPAVSYRFSDAVLRTTGTHTRYRRALTAVAYLLAGASFAAVVFTPRLVTGVGQKGRFYHFVAGPLFWVFATYYLLISLAAWL